MRTPQEIQEITFSKAVFGGYDMETVDQFVEPLVEDYVTLYNENAVLKSKLKVLVAKLEEYRDTEAQRLAAEEESKKACEQMKKDAEEQSRKILQEAEAIAASRNTEEKIQQEEYRLNCAKQLALNFIDVLEKDIDGHLELLKSLRQRDLAYEVPSPVRKQDYDVKIAEEKKSSASKIASEIEENLQKLGLSDDEAVPSVQEEIKESPTKESPTIKFSDLQFGKNYDPMGN